MSKRKVFPFPKLALGKSSDLYLEKLVWAGIAKKYKKPLSQKLSDRIKYELYTIETLGNSNLFIFTHDIVEYAKKQNIRICPGHGAILGSVVAYALNIINVDPIANERLLERFISYEREKFYCMLVDFDCEVMSAVMGGGV